MKKTLPIWIWVAIIILVIGFIGVSVLYTPEKSPTPDNRTWHYVTNFIGTDTGVAYPVTIKGDEFRLTYSVAQDEYRDLLTIFVVPANLTNLWGNKGKETIITNPDKSINVSFSVMEMMGVAPITISENDYKVYQGTSAGNLTKNVQDLLSWKSEQQYENTGTYSVTYLSEEYARQLGERKMVRNGYSNFFMSFNNATQTDISYAGAGEYYLVIDTDSVDSWTMLVEDYY